MKLLRKYINLNSNWFWIFIIFVFSILASRTLIHKGYFPMHDDLQMMRQLEMDKCFKNLQIPCRWVADMGYGFGFPLFNFYPPLPYLVGQIFVKLGFPFTDVPKILFSLSFFVSGIGMFFLVKEFLSSKELDKEKLNFIGPLISAVFYIWAPYHALDVYVRGAMNEAWALIFFPYIFLFAYKLIKEDKIKWLILLSFSWLGLLTSHNLMVLIFTPIFAIWCLIWMLKEKHLVTNIKYLISSGILAFLLAAFFTIPAILEQKFVQVSTLVTGYYEFIAHFSSINQILFSRFWGYGASVWGLEDKMSFQIGHIHWMLSIIIIVLWLITYVFKRKKLKFYTIKTTFLILPFMFLVGWFSLFMTHSKSTFIWQSFSPLRFVQFPWRFLTLATFTFSFMSGFVVLFIKPLNKLKFPLISLLLIILVAFNWNYFKVERTGPVTDEEKFSGEAWRLQQTAGIYDYLPIWAKQAPQSSQKYLAEVMSGEAIISDSYQITNYASFNIDVSSQTSKIRIGIFKYPGWVITIDGVEISYSVPKEEIWGRMWIEVSRGKHEIEARFVNTPVRTVSNLISLISWLGLGAYLMLQFKRGRRNRH